MPTSLTGWQQVFPYDFSDPTDPNRPFVAKCSEFLIDTGHSELTPDILNDRLLQKHLNTGIPMIELYLYRLANTAPYVYVVALDLSLKRPIPNNSNSPPGLSDWCLTLGIDDQCGDNACTIYERVKEFVKEQITPPIHRSVFVVWDANGTITPGVLVDEIFQLLDNDSKVHTVPPKADQTRPVKAYAHYKKHLGPHGMLRRLEIKSIQS